MTLCPVTAGEEAVTAAGAAEEEAAAAAEVADIAFEQREKLSCLLATGTCEKYKAMKGR